MMDINKIQSALQSLKEERSHIEEYIQNAAARKEEFSKEQLISMIHFLEKREDERAQENQELKDMVKELRDTHKQDVKTQTNLLKSIDRLTNQVADLTTDNKMLQQLIDELQK